MAAISRGRSAGDRSASVVVCMGMLLSPACACSHADRGCAHDDLGFASGAPSGWSGISLLFPYPVEVRNGGVGCGAQGGVKPAGISFPSTTPNAGKDAFAVRPQ